ncbi:DegT/DnrJ/EryC1/StrS family aminotransferase, partial [Pseudoxanthomonas sp. SGD-10]
MQSYRSVKMIDLPAEYQDRKTEFDKAIEEVLRKGDFIKGKAVIDFEQAFSTYLGTKHVISCGNGTDALQIALMASGIKKGDEVILPAFSYVAVIEVVCLLKAKPVLVEVDPVFFQIEPKSVSDAITDRTRAIIPVHLFGQCGNMTEILQIAEQHNLYVIEDAAQAIGASYKNRKLGTLGHIGCTSFFPTKNLACYGDGGAVITDDDDIAERIRMIASHGQRRKYHHEILGVNSRLDTIQAAILNVKLKYLDDNLAIKKAVAERYLADLQGIGQILTPEQHPSVSHSWHQFTIRAKDGSRDSLKDWLKNKGVDSMI